MNRINLYSMEQQQWWTEDYKVKRLQSNRVKTDMLRSIGKQSRESVESVLKKKR